MKPPHAKPPATPRLILASQSASRAALLRAAGLTIKQIPPHINESQIKKNFTGKVEDLALTLAREKAMKISTTHPNDWIIAADQILWFENNAYDKSTTIDEARRLLKKLRGKSHQLIGGHALVKKNKLVWQHLSHVQLTLRSFSNQALEKYITATTPKLLDAVGGYQLEGPAVQLFSHIEGDYFAVLGLDLLPLLKALREQNALLS